MERNCKLRAEEGCNVAEFMLPNGGVAGWQNAVRNAAGAVSVLENAAPENCGMLSEALRGLCAGFEAAFPV